MNNLSYIISSASNSITLAFKNPETDKFVSVRLSKLDERYSALLDIISLPDDDHDDHLETPKETQLMELLYPKVADISALAVSVNGKLEFNGKLLPAVLVRKLEGLAQEGVSTAPFENFMERLEKNPSASSVNELYDFLSYRDLPITPDGCFMAYKGVREDYWSVSGNPDTVVEEGEVDPFHRILNEVGSTIRVNRNQVDDNRNKHCSFGLHVGSHSYANGFGDRMILVKVDPADAVSVPTDCSFQKLRVCAYTVVADYEREISTQSVTEEGTEIVGDSQQLQRSSTAARVDYIESVRVYLSEVEEELANLHSDHWDEDEVDFLTVLARVGGNETTLKDALQSLNRDWDSYSQVIYI
jgi:hypothetical protein|tara:strand:+ start:5159 stop:6229 length:1071 start_codon:yes stop_codon:yes gene_type:complete